MNKPVHIVFLLGMPGSGKTTLGRYAASKLHKRFIDLDEQIESETEMSVSRLFEQWGEERFREKEGEVLEKIKEQCVEDTLVATGGGTPCFNKRMEWMNAVGTTVWLRAEVDFLTNNIMQAEAVRPLFKGFSGATLKEQLQKMLEQRAGFYGQNHVELSVYKGLSPDLFTKRLHLSTFAKWE